MNIYPGTVINADIAKILGSRICGNSLRNPSRHCFISEMNIYPGTVINADIAEILGSRICGNSLRNPGHWKHLKLC